MKSMEEYINSVYERYEESEKNHEVYKKVRMTRKRPLNTLCGVIAGLLVVCVCLVGHNKFNKQPIVDTPVFVDKIENQSITYTQYISVNSILGIDGLKKIVEKSDIIAIIDDFKIENVTSSIRKKKVYVETNGNLSLNHVYKGRELIFNNVIKCSVVGGKISFLELEENLNYDWNTWEILNFKHNIKEKENTYYELIVEKAQDFEKGKKYLVFLLKDSNSENNYTLVDNVYGIMEYDPITNKVKNIDTGEFEEFDWSLLKGN